MVLCLPEKLDILDMINIDPVQLPRYQWRSLETAVNKIFVKSEAVGEGELQDFENMVRDPEGLLEDMKLNEQLKLAKILEEEKRHLKRRFKFDNINHTLENLITRALFELIDYSKITNLTQLNK